MLPIQPILSFKPSFMADAGAAGVSWMHGNGAFPQEVPLAVPAMAMHPNVSDLRGHAGRTGLQGAGTYTYPTPPETASSASSLGAAVVAPQHHDRVLCYPRASRAPRLPWDAAVPAADVMPHRGMNGKVFLDPKDALFVYGPALQTLGLTERAVHKYGAEPDGPLLLATLSQTLPQLYRCGFTLRDLPFGVVRMMGPRNLQGLAQHAPRLSALGWGKSALLRLAKQRVGAERLAELALHGQALLLQEHGHRSLAEFAMSPGNLQRLAAPTPTVQHQGFVGTTSQGIDCAPSGTTFERHDVLQRAVIPIEFSAEELRLLEMHRGAERVRALKKVSGLLDSRRIKTGVILRVAHGTNGGKYLEDAYSLAPAFAELNVDVADIFRMLSHNGGAKTLTTLLKVSPQLHRLRFDAASQVRMATRSAGSEWIDALAQHAEDVLRLGWSHQNLLHFVRLPNASSCLAAVQSHGAQLRDLGFSPDRLLRILKRGRGSEVLSALAASGSLLAPSIGFSLEQVEKIATVEMGDKVLMTLQRVIGELHLLAYGSSFLTQMAENGGGTVAYEYLSSCHEHLRCGLPSEVLLRAASRKDCAGFLSTIQRHWPALSAGKPDAARLLDDALSKQQTAPSFDAWVLGQLL